ncbi:MAG TPA: CDP-alcohol phosphatidyltransferase family protein [Acidimicrobiia bacterium]
MIDGEGDRGQASSAIVTIPNLVSLARLLLVPLFLWLLLGVDEIAAAGWLLAIIGGTDWVDGYLARRLGQVSEMGKMLDPVADRLAVVAAVIGGLIAGVLPGWFVWGLIVREAVVAGLALYLGLRMGRRLEVRFLGKAATLILYAAISCWFIGVGTAMSWLEQLAEIGALVGLVLYYAVMVSYVGDARTMVVEARRSEGPLGTLPDR